MTVTKEAHSGVAPITVNERGNPFPNSNAVIFLSLYYTGENSIVIVSGANMELTPTDVQAAAHLVQGAKVVVCQLEVPLDTSLEALRLAKQNGGLCGHCSERYQVLFIPTPTNH